MRFARFRTRRFPLLALAGVFIVLLIATVWFASPIGELLPAAEAALESDARVRVNREPWLVFEPVSSEFTRGFILYPGGRVAPEAYAPLARTLAEQGTLAVITPMPLNFAIFNPAAADAVIDAYPQVSVWLIGGHSLGGVMAARYAHDNPERVAGLVLLAAYPEAHIDLSGRELAVATIYGDRDGLVSLDEIAGSLALLPAAARTVLIAGGNHAQFGFYGAQDGDRPAGIGREEQQAQVQAAISELLVEIASA